MLISVLKGRSSRQLGICGDADMDVITGDVEGSRWIQLESIVVLCEYPFIVDGVIPCRWSIAAVLSGAELWHVPRLRSMPLMRRGTGNTESVTPAPTAQACADNADASMHCACTRP